MKFTIKLSSILKSKKGDMFVGPIFAVLGIVAVVALVTANLKSDMIAGEVKRSTKQEMNNLSHIIASDIYNAMIQGNLPEYDKQLHTSTAYQNNLLRIVEEDIKNDLKLIKTGDKYQKISAEGVTEYYLTDFKIRQEDTANKLKYTISFDIVLNYRFAGTSYDGFKFPVSYDVYHIKNY